ncbi:MAG: STAS domain-containing protein [Ruminococcaceae bacterium]|nr:STAS domain-containing protein [Oscillospiraceae bacterium]
MRQNSHCGCYIISKNKGSEIMSVTIKRKNDYIYAFIKGEIDHHTAPEIRETIDDALSTSESAKMLVLDFNEVSFMDSSGVGLVMGRYRYATTLGKKIRVDNLDNRNYKIMQMSGIERIAEINKKGEEN